ALERKHAAAQAVDVELLDGALLVQAAAARAVGDDRGRLESWASRLRTGAQVDRIECALADDLRQLVRRYPDRMFSSRTATCALVVDPERARFSAWYELFPRSFGRSDKHGTFEDVERTLPYIASMGFDVLYLPPI